MSRPSTSTAVKCMTGRTGCNSFRKESRSKPFCESQRAPSKYLKEVWSAQETLCNGIVSYIPWTKAPSSGCFSAPSGWNDITAVDIVTLSKAHIFFLAVTCMTAVTNAMGLKNPPSQMLLGMTNVSCHFCSCSILKIKSTYQSLKTEKILRHCRNDEMLPYL